MNQERLINKTMDFIKDRFSKDFSGHDYHHSLRVFKTATTICKKEKGDLLTVQLAALLHDVDDYKLFGTNEEPFECATGYLKENGFEEEDIKKICKIISQISFKGTDTQVPDTLEGKIVQDADRLDAIGAIGIARTFAFGGNKNRAIHLPEEKPQLGMDFETYSKAEGTSINHFYEKLIDLKDMINTEAGKELAHHRHEYMMGFLKEFFEEWDGEK